MRNADNSNNKVIGVGTLKYPDSGDTDTFPPPPKQWQGNNPYSDSVLTTLDSTKVHLRKPTFSQGLKHYRCLEISYIAFINF